MAARIALLTYDLTGFGALASGLVSRGFSCEVSSQSLPDKAIDLAVVDLEGPRVLSAQEAVLRHIREQRRLPVVVLIDEVAMEEWESSAEVDDFVVKPVRLNELAARIRRVLARAEGTTEDPHTQAENLTIDTDAYQVFVGDKAIDLTFREYELLKFLASNPGTVFSREALLNRVWGYDYYGGERTVDVHIRRLRSKIEVGDQTFIETVRGVGYRFKEASDQGFRRDGSAPSTESHRRL